MVFVRPALIFGTRVATGPFMPSYYLGDVIWLVLAMLQGLTWYLWRIHGVALRR